MEQEAEVKERECPACLGTGEVTVRTEEDAELERRICRA